MVGPSSKVEQEQFRVFIVGDCQTQILQGKLLKQDYQEITQEKTRPGHNWHGFIYSLLWCRKDRQVIAPTSSFRMKTFKFRGKGKQSSSQQLNCFKQCFIGSRYAACLEYHLQTLLMSKLLSDEKKYFECLVEVCQDKAWQEY